MQIKKIQINGFGNLNNKEIELCSGLNIINGKNESGKSTLVDFIKSMFYGINKNKAGSEFSEFERFKPWRDTDFSGKIEYEHDGETYIVTREFSKNNCRIYDKEGNDITNEFNKDKSRGAEIGLIHLGIDEDTFVSSSFIRQQGVKVENDMQQTIIQKLTNIIQVGEEGLSYEKALGKLKKILLDEVGTDKTQNKPKNLIDKEVIEKESEKIHFINNRKKHEDIIEKRRILEERKLDLERNLNGAIPIYEVRKKYCKQLQEKREAINTAKKLLEKENIENEKRNKKRRRITGIVIAILSTILAVVLTILNLYAYALLIGTLGIICAIIYGKIKPRKENIFGNELDFDLIQEEINKKERQELEQFKNGETKINLFQEKIENLESLINNLGKNKQNYELEIHKLDIEEETIKMGVNRLNEIEEELSLAYEKKALIKKKEDILKFAIDVLEKSYAELKKEVIPNIEKSIKDAVTNTTNGKYSNIIYNDKEGLLVENDVGNIITINKLSIGTIDQIYLGFRLAMINNLNKNLPIIFDENFVYFDEERLENIMNVLKKIAENSQIIILSCANREKVLLEKNDIRFNYIEIK